MGQFIPTKGFSPSADPTVANTLLSVSNMVPTLNGMRSAYSPVSAGLPALSSRCYGAAATTLLAGTRRVFAGTSTDLYEDISNVWTSVSRTSGGAYAGGQNQWRFAQFGNATLAANGADKIQQSIDFGPFSDIATAPAARIVFSVQGFVFALDTTDTANGHRTNGWACSALYDQSNWTPAQATQAANGVIVDTPGGITAGRALGTNIMVYKLNSCFYGSYQGVPVIWAFNQISPTIGVTCQEAVVDVGNAHIFIGTDCQIYTTTGSLPTPVGDSVKDWIYSNRSPTYQDIMQSYHDAANTLVYWYFCSNTSNGVPDIGLVYNYRTGEFGRADNNVEAALQVISGQITWDGLGSLPGVSTWDTLPTIPYNSSYWTSASQLAGIIDNTHTMYTLSGVAGRSSISTSYFGDDENFTYLKWITPRFSKSPSSCSATGVAVSSLGGIPTSFAAGDLYDGILTTDISGRWYQITMIFTGNAEILGFAPTAIKSGSL